MIKPFVAAILGLGLNEAAYMAEIVRAGIISVDHGQTEAAQALGMTRLQVMRRIVLPQAMRVIIPPTGNETISMLKTTSLAAVIAYPELLYSVQLIYSVNYQTIPLLIVASIWYLVVTSILTVGQYYIERHYGRGPPASFRRRRCSAPASAFSFGHATRVPTGAGTRGPLMATPMVQAEGVHKSFGRLEVLKGITLEVAPGEVMCLLGPSGSGKSTFLRCINHLEKIDYGRLWVDGDLVGYREAGDKIHELRESEVARRRADIGMVFQSFNLFPHMTVLDNVIEAPCGCARSLAPRCSSERTSCSSGSGWRTSSTPTRRSSRAASSSASPSRGRLPCAEADAVRRADLGA